MVMSGFKPVVAVVAALLLAGCGGDGDAGTSLKAEPATTAPPPATGPCGLKPLAFTAERGQGSGQAAPRAGGVLWEQEYTFSNPNTVDVRLSSMLVELDLSGADGHFFKSVRTTLRSVPDDVVPAGREQKRFAHAWLAPGNSPTTDSLFPVATARVAGAECPVTVERVADRPPPQHVLALPNCDPEQAAAPC